MLARMAAAAWLMAVLACGSVADAGPQSVEPSGELLVFAAASLTDAFTDIAAELAETHPDLEVILGFAGSHQLAGQIAQGAPADVFAAADPQQMDVVAEADSLAGSPRIFAGNLLAIAVEPGNPGGITTLEDLADPNVTLVMAAPAVPAGEYARQALNAAGVEVTAASLEVDVRAVLSKVALGEADAGIVYRSDVLAARDAVDGVEIPAADNVNASYPIAVLDRASNPAGARAFVDLVTSDDGQAILREHGFTTP